MDYTKTDEIKEYLEKTLTPKRYTHSLGVAREAVKLASIYGVNQEKAYFAGLVHDIAKCYSVEEMNRQIRDFGMSLWYWNNQSLAHSKIGKRILARDFGVDDQDILNAVSYHTTGRYGMSMLEEIIYVSAAVEVNRTYSGVRRLRHLARYNLDEACLEILDFCIDSITYRNRILDPDTTEARDFILEKLKRRD